MLCIDRAGEKSGRPGRLCDVMMTCGPIWDVVWNLHLFTVALDLVHNTKTLFMNEAV